MALHEPVVHLNDASSETLVSTGLTKWHPVHISDMRHQVFPVRDSCPQASQENLPSMCTVKRDFTLLSLALPLAMMTLLLIVNTRSWYELDTDVVSLPSAVFWASAKIGDSVSPSVSLTTSLDS